MILPKPAVCWSINEIGTLDDVSFRSPLSVTAGSFTLTMWFYAAKLTGRQIIVRLNAPDTDGWSIILEGTSLHAEYGSDEVCAARLDGLTVARDRWTFAALAYDADRRTFWLSDGVTSTQAQIEAASVNMPREIVIGGYTDPAGGHYDYTFGRSRSGLADEVCVFDRVLELAEIAGLGAVGGHIPDARIALNMSGDAPCDVWFEAHGCEGTRGALWDFGDGSSALGRLVQHRYEYAGTYTVRLTVIGDGHRQATTETELTLAGAADPLQRVAVFVNGTEGHACYRIPSIVRAENGDLLAFAEGRRDSCSDSTPSIRVVSKRSRDNGRHWEPLQLVARHIHQTGEYALMNPSPVVDLARGTGRIVLLYNASTTNEWELARGEGRNHTFCIVSRDQGETWSEPREISEEIRGAPDWRIQRPTLGHALQREDGRIIHASTITVGDASVFESQNVLFWSDDLGETWRHGEPCATIGLNEVTAAMLEDGGVLLNSRAYIDSTPAGRRAITRAEFDTDDRIRYGQTIYDAALIDSAVQASLLQLTSRRQVEFGGRSRLLFCNPAHPHARLNMTVRLSSDEGRTWSHQRVIDAGPSSYSDLVQQADGRIGVLYERGNQGGIAYVAFTLEWLTQNADSLDQPIESDPLL